MELREALYEVGDDGVATITLNRPEQRNPLGPQMVADLTAALRRAKDDDAVRAVVLTGAGDKAFCAGADLSSWAADAGEVERHLARGAFVELFLTCERLGKPLIGCINGHALAGGFGLALCCDLLVSADTRHLRHAGDQGRRVADDDHVDRHPQPRPQARARALHDGRAHRRGDRAAVGLRQPGGARGRGARGARTRGPRRSPAWSPLVMHLGRDAFYATDSLDYESALRYLQAQLTVVSMTEDFREGVTAFLEKRAPNFRGR